MLVKDWERMKRKKDGSFRIPGRLCELCWETPFIHVHFEAMLLLKQRLFSWALWARSVLRA